MRTGAQLHAVCQGRPALPPIPLRSDSRAGRAGYLGSLILEQLFRTCPGVKKARTRAGRQMRWSSPHGVPEHCLPGSAQNGQCTAETDKHVLRRKAWCCRARAPSVRSEPPHLLPTLICVPGGSLASYSQRSWPAEVDSAGHLGTPPAPSAVTLTAACCAPAGPSARSPAPPGLLLRARLCLLRRALRQQAGPPRRGGGMR